MTLKIQSDGTRLFDTGKNHIGDGLMYGFVLQHKTPKGIQKSLRKMVPYNTTLRDMLDDMMTHDCGSVRLTVDDDRTMIEVGFKCTCGIKWRIPLAELKACCVHFPEYEEVIKTTESREHLARSISEKAFEI